MVFNILRYYFLKIFIIVVFIIITFNILKYIKQLLYFYY